MSANISTASFRPAVQANYHAAVARTVFIATAIAAFALASFAASPHATAVAIDQDGASLTRLLRFMAIIKTLAAAGALAMVVWRLALPARLLGFAAYAAAGAAMAAGPVLIWTLTHIAAGAILLHGGLAATILLLWRDPATAARLGQMLAARRR